MAKIFISYSRVDKRSFVEPLIKNLRDQYGYNQVWHDERLIGGPEWWRQILNEINRCEVFVYVLTNDSLESQYCKAEHQEALRLGIPIIPVQARAKTKIPPELAKYQHIDMTDKVNDTQSVTKLFEAIDYQSKLPRPRLPNWEPETPSPDHFPARKRANYIRNIVIAIFLIIVLAGLFYFSSLILGEQDTPPTRTLETTNIANKITETFTDEAITPPTDTSIYTPTSTDSVTDTLSYTATQIETSTDEPSVPPTDTSTYTPTPTDSMTDTPTFTVTPANTSTNPPVHTAVSVVGNTPFEIAESGVISNDEWEIYSEIFDDVEMVLVPSGCFQMGYVDGDDDQKPVHPQCITQPFWISQYEITRDQYQLCVEAEICLPVPESEVSTQNRQPINQTTWFDAKTYCEWKNGRLPTEVEWEYAARGPDNLLYAWGNEYIPENLVHGYNSGDIPAYVGSKKEGISWVGAYDLNGNIREWTSSLQFDYPYNRFDGREDPTRTNYHRTARGGFYGGLVTTMYLSTDRWHESPNERSDTLGIRCVRDYDFDYSTQEGDNPRGVEQETSSSFRDLQNRAERGIFNNNDWQPHTQIFNEVEMVLVPAGSFTMGLDEADIDFVIGFCVEERGICEDEIYYTKETPANIQIFELPFWIDKTEVTNAMYSECIADGECRPIEEVRRSIINDCIEERWDETDETVNYCLPGFSLEGNQPVILPFVAAHQYCEWREARLPTEAEWEYAARGPDNLLYPWGNEFDGNFVNHCDLNCSDISWGVFEYEFGYLDASTEFDDGYSNASPVRSYPLNASWIGALDMSGNVAEWASTNGSDEFPYPYATDDGREQGITERSENDQIVRGGSFMSAPYRLLALYRPTYTTDWLITGVRCVKDYSPNDLAMSD
ncbi:MAG: SUMF1/EgtB/PvdO family nonheme iron enzyme [Chloroflexi bacterium]|nr:SUMF1/EgtB/PvdO family nonheme iron enzyme [Chloroflexota bacterium]